MAVLTTMADIQEVPTKRFSSTFPEIDEVFGQTKTYGPDRRVIQVDKGIARGKLIAIAGDPGVGKTKFYTLVSIMLAEKEDRRIVVFQKEMTAGEYKAMVLNMYHSLGMEPKRLGNIIVEQSNVLSRQLEVIQQAAPDLVVDDSFNLTVTPNAKTEKGIQEIVTGWKGAMRDHSAAWFIAHQRGDGDVKGNSHLKYMVDGLFFMRWDKSPRNDWEKANPDAYRSRYLFVSGKNRQGLSDVSAVLRHKGDHVEVGAYTGVVPVAKKVCQVNQEVEDEGLRLALLDFFEKKH